tara:strand:+ start:1032 stop:1328 length:297 start_codon:yes stop_codon:yes gene_type:complete
MSKKKSYMDSSNILNEGFFTDVAKFATAAAVFRKLNQLPIKTSKGKKKKKLNLLNKVKNIIATSGINKDVAKFEKMLKKQLGKDYPDMPRFTPKDFIK